MVSTINTVLMYERLMSINQSYEYIREVILDIATTFKALSVIRAVYNRILARNFVDIRIHSNKGNDNQL